MAAEGTCDGATVAAVWNAGTGRFVGANPPGAYRIEGDPQRCCGAALGAFGAWAEVIDLAWQLGAHPVSDEDRAIAAGKHGASCAYFTCRGRSIGETLGRCHLTTGQVRHRMMPRLERHNRELRRRENLGTVWTEHNLPALLPEQGLSNQSI